MVEKIYIWGTGGALEPLTERPISSGVVLLRLIMQHPELLASEQMRPDDPLRCIFIWREMTIEGGRLTTDTGPVRAPHAV